MSSDWNEGTDRQAVRHTHGESPYQQTRDKGKSKYKNTRKWCKGKVGRPHNFQPAHNNWGWSEKYDQQRGIERLVDVCNVCGKRGREFKVIYNRALWEQSWEYRLFHRAKSVS